MPVLLLLTLGAALGAVGCNGRRSDEFHALRNVEAESIEWKLGRREGTHVRSEHYDIYTTLSDPRLVDSLAGTMETALAFYKHLMPAASEPPERMPVYLFARRDEFEAFTRQTFGPRADTLLRVRQGGFSEQGVTVIEYVTHAVAFPVLTHEGFHQFIHHCTPGRIPAWLNEGLATACEGQRWSQDRIRSFAPRYNPPRRNALAEALLRNEIFPTAELLRINAGDVIGDSRRRAATYYAQLWAMILFLMEDAEYRDGFDRLLSTAASEDIEPHARAAAIRSGRYQFGVSTFQAFITDDIDEFDSRFRQWMEREILSAR